MYEREHAFELYLYDIQDLPLLDAEAEQRLVTQLVAGRAAQTQLATTQDLEPEQLMALSQAAAAGAEARAALIAAHLRLVIRIARQYTGRGISLLDLIQEGNLALMEAADHVDPAHGVRFATYATWWIRHAVAQARADAAQPVRLPNETRAKLYRLYRAQAELRQELAREPQDHELAAALGLPLDEVRRLRGYLQPVVSLNQPQSDDDTIELADLVPDPVAELQLDSASHAALAEELGQLLRVLRNDERAVLALRFGLGGGPLLSRQDTAEQLGLAADHVRQIEARALRKLRSSELIERLRDYVDP